MAEKSEPVDIQYLQDIRPPFGVALSGIYKKSLAYDTLSKRLPDILTAVINSMSCNKIEIEKKYGEKSSDEMKTVSGIISQLIHDIITNKELKPIKPLHTEFFNDSKEWNKYLETKTKNEGSIPKWFNTEWLYCESYMYRTLAQQFFLQEHLEKYDYFGYPKRNAFINSLKSIESLCKYTLNPKHKEEFMSNDELQAELTKFLKITLWGNKCDLSLSDCSDVNPNPTEPSNTNILVDDSQNILNLLQDITKDKIVIVDIILDNAGYELFTDLCLAEFLIVRKLASKVRFYVKHYPWFVSDSTKEDFCWLLEYMKNSRIEVLRKFSNLAYDYLKDNIWTIEEEPYWTGPYDFTLMKEKDPALYNKISLAKLAIFKGDLNYRKLIADINWEYTTKFLKALKHFLPTNILSLRTVKSDVCVGLSPGVAEKLFAADGTWMTTGQYGLIQTALLKVDPESARLKTSNQ